MFSRSLKLRVSVYNSTTTITRMYVLKATVIKRVSLKQYYYYHTNVCSEGHCYESVSLLQYHYYITRMYVLKVTVIKSVRLEKYYYYHMNVCSQEHCYQKGQFTTVLLLSHECMFSRSLLMRVSIYNSTTTITRIYVCSQGHCYIKCQFTTLLLP